MATPTVLCMSVCLRLENTNCFFVIYNQFFGPSVGYNRKKCNRFLDEKAISKKLFAVYFRTKSHFSVNVYIVFALLEKLSLIYIVT